MYSRTHWCVFLALLGLPLGMNVPAIGAETVGEESSERFRRAVPLVQDRALAHGATQLAPSTDSIAPAHSFLNLLEAETIAPSRLAQSTPIIQLQDIHAQHWAAQALRQLSQAYPCLPSYFTDEAVLTRYEFADVLNRCLDVITPAMLGTPADTVTQHQWTIVQRLQNEFQTELTTLGDRLDSLETQISTLTDQQFIKRTTLSGTAEFVLMDTFGDSFNLPPGRRPAVSIPNANTTFTTGNLSLSIDAKVQGQNFVRTTLVASNLPANGRTHTGTDMTRINASPSSSGNFSLNSLFYQTRYAQNGILRVGPLGLVANSVLPDLTPTRANSRFGARSMIYRPGSGAGAITNYQVNDWLALGGGYTVGGGDAADPAEGFLSSQHRFIAQGTVTPNPRLGVALTYSHLYANDAISITGAKGSRNAQAPFGDTTATSAHLFGIKGNYRVSRRLGIGGWVSYTQARAEADATINNPPLPGRSLLGTVQDGDRADIWTWAVTMAISDVFQKGNEMGFVFGMPPKAVSNNFRPFEDAGATSYHAEIYYRHRVTPRFMITPGLYAVFNPEHNGDNATQVVGLLRSVMRF